MSKPPKIPKAKPRWVLTEAFLLGYEEVHKGICYGDAWQRAMEHYGRPERWTGYSGINPPMALPVRSPFESYMDGEYIRVAGK